ncbi:S8 family peptidase [Corallococcus interemptor]|uniref:S8 family peptidase n=1 Tax=Corallococcus interemptor TaxID=2316720 RepID=UPI0035D4F535
MAERPLLLLLEATSATRGKKGGGGGGPAKLGAARQQERLGLRLHELETAFESRRVLFQTAASGLVPEDVLVLETAGTVDQFIKAVSRIEGFEFLAEYDEQDIPPDEDFFTDEDGSHVGYTGRVYMVFSNQDAFRQLLRLWQLWQSGGTFERGYTKWRDVFSLLRDIRPWGVKDRLEETGVLTDWNERVQLGADVVHCEIELWFRTNEQRRLAAAQVVRARVQDLGGSVISEGVIAGIHYHGLAVQLPIQAVQQVLNTQTRDQVQLVQSEQIQFFRAAGQMAVRERGETRSLSSVLAGPAPEGEPRVALLDGLPLQNHRALANRLVIDDPDGFEADYRVDARQHGTAMASLIIWGDLNETTRTPIPHPLYVRPIMRPVVFPDWMQQEAFERVPDGVLVVDLVHRAVRRLFEPEGDSAPAAPKVAIVNFSMGILDRPFLGIMSPLARLLDWLSWRYNTLFVVSAGNHLHPVETGKPWSELEVLSSASLATVLVQSLAADTRNRRTLSPAEAMNALTVGALHADADTSVQTSRRLDPLPVGYPSPLNAHGLGYRRSIKPELLVPGGRLQFDRPVLNRDTRLRPVRVAAAPGMEVAAPGTMAGDVAHTAKSRGTSNAAAMLSRIGAFLAPVVHELRQGAGGNALAAVSDAVIIKALLVHGVRWGELGPAIQSHFGTNQDADELIEQLTRLLGFGPLDIADITDIAECSATRVTAIGAGVLAADSGAEHRFPLPPSLSGKRGWRRLAITLAWFTPVNPLSHKWRKAHLWFEAPKSKLKVSRIGPDWQTGQRGTLQHDTFEGESAAAFVDGEDIVVRVSCREDAPGLEGTIPYAVAVTLEVGEDLGIDIYTEVRERVRQRLQVRAAGAP